MSNNILSNLLSFNKMISEQIIKIVYYIGLIVIALGFLGQVYLSFTAGFVGFVPALLMAIAGAILGVLLWRVFCESIIILFRLYARLGDINTTLGGTNKDTPIPGDAALQEMRDAAIKAKNAAADRAKAIKSSIHKDDDEELHEMDLKPAAETPVTKPAAKKTATRKKASATTAAKETATKKAPAKKAPAKKPVAKKPATKT